MSTTTATFAPDISTVTTGAIRSRKSWLQRLIDTRARQGEARVRHTFAHMPDALLADIGFTPDQIRHVRARGAVPADFWG